MATQKDGERDFLKAAAERAAAVRARTDAFVHNLISRNEQLLNGSITATEYYQDLIGDGSFLTTCLVSSESENDPNQLPVTISRHRTGIQVTFREPQDKVDTTVLIGLDKGNKFRVKALGKITVDGKTIAANPSNWKNLFGETEFDTVQLRAFNLLTHAQIPPRNDETKYTDTNRVSKPLDSRGYQTLERDEQTRRFDEALIEGGKLFREGQINGREYFARVMQDRSPLATILRTTITNPLGNEETYKVVVQRTENNLLQVSCRNRQEKHPAFTAFFDAAEDNQLAVVGVGILDPKGNPILANDSNWDQLFSEYSQDIWVKFSNDLLLNVEPLRAQQPE